LSIALIVLLPIGLLVLVGLAFAAWAGLNYLLKRRTRSERERLPGDLPQPLPDPLPRG